MIELTVKTLDSQNHVFSVDDDMTVAQFKEKIADTVNIPADTQRIIYCGRVLQDASKLSEYDVNGKVVHLVQRPPPSTNPPPSEQQPESPTTQPRVRRIRGLEYLGSLRLPANAIDENVMPPLPTHSLAASRLNIAKRMLRRAEGVLNNLENPSARPTDHHTQDAHGEVTPVFEARVIVPNVPTNDSVSDPEVISAVNSLMNSVRFGVLNGTQATVPTSNTVQVHVSDPLAPSNVEVANNPVNNHGEVISSVNSLMNSVSFGRQTASPTSNTVQVHASDPLAPSNVEADTLHSDASTPDIASPLATSSENLTNIGEDQGAATPADEATSTTTNPSNSANNSQTETISRTAEYAELLDKLVHVQSRFAPFLEEYHNFMRDDPPVALDNARNVQGMINRVSEILHFLGHAFHSLSDIIVRVRTPPPRPLLCRPILIQHSAILQAGIPIQVEAQISVSADRPGNGNRVPSTQPSAANANDSNTTTTTAGAAPPTQSNTAPTIAAHIPSMVGFPLIPGAGVRVEAFHIPHPQNINLDRTTLNTNNNNNRDIPLTSANVTNQPRIVTSNVTSSANGTGGLQFGNQSNRPSQINSIVNALIASSVMDDFRGNNIASSGQSTTDNSTGSNQPGSVNNPVEFFMEVTPESITIDSLETAFVGPNQANDLLQGALNPPPELIQSIMQMAGQLINRGTQQGAGNIAAVVTGSAPSAPQSEASATNSQIIVTTNGGAARVIPFQNSQARGNTQTQPTTATHTRSTPRPHVRFAQHAMQGFDPFLPCNSHHVTRRRLHSIGTQHNPQSQSNATPNQPNAEGGTEPRTDPNNPLYNIMRSIINTVQHAYNPTTASQPPQTASATSNNANPTGITPPWMSTLENMNLSDSGFLRNPAPTIAQLLQQFPDESYTEGESIFTDLIMLLSRNLTISDVIQINGGRLEPLTRIRTQLRNFFLYRILDGCQGTIAVDRGVDRLLNELQPFLDHLSGLETRDDIDIVRSVQTLLRARLPNIIALVASRSPNSLKMVVDQIRTTGRQFCALAVRASQNGRQGVENMFDLILSRYMQGIPQDLQEWTLMTSRAHMILVLSSLDVPESILQPYIVREVDAITPTVVNESDAVQRLNFATALELMQVDEEAVVAGGSSPEEHSLPAINLADDPEPLPQVVYGSESWHGQVPSDWVPIITRDTQRQRRQNSQPPFSDAYLSGMPSKRRKIVANTKPQGSLPQVITESVRQAVSATGLAAVAPLETVAAAAGDDLNVQSAYRNLLRTSVQSGLTNNQDFTPERFPNANNYFNNYPQ